MNSTAWRATAVTAAIYGYFLLFAQFAFVELLRGQLAALEGNAADLAEKAALGLMALAGIASGFWVARKGATPQKIRSGLILAAVVSGAAPWASGLWASILVAILTGVSVGVATVSLAPMLRSWCRLMHVGIGTGIGYACCNLPFVFTQTPSRQAGIAAVFALVGAAFVPAKEGTANQAPARVFPFPVVVLLFTALVWLDSAAFFIIQHATDLKQGTWGEGLLWRNAFIHLLAACVAGAWLHRGNARSLPAIAWAMLAVAAVAVNHDSSRLLGGWLYPAAVSLYSTALVAWPGWFSGAKSTLETAMKAAWLYAIAGWFGSANGIGMAQSLHRVPVEFIALTGVLVGCVMLYHSLKNWRTTAAILLIAVVAFWPRQHAELPTDSPAERGKQVYLAEGCIHCHSQYVRPGTPDDEYWGPSLRKALEMQPVLIGNRRQGPDLSTVGARRSAGWLKEHFINPQLFSPGTAMPTYASLFESSRGDDLVAYLKQLEGSEMAAIATKSAAWKPKDVGTSHANGKDLFATQCALCHGPTGFGDGEIAAKLFKAPANLLKGPFVWSPSSPDLELRVRQIIKFGLPGTDMPGHETLTDEQVIALAKYVLSLRS